MKYVRIRSSDLTILYEIHPRRIISWTSPNSTFSPTFPAALDSYRGEIYLEIAPGGIGAYATPYLCLPMPLL